jgi:hypothetical protein
MTKPDNELQAKAIAAFKIPPVQLHEDTFAWKPIEKSPITYYLRFFGERPVCVNVEPPHSAAGVDRFLQELRRADLDAVNELRAVALLPSAVAAEQGQDYRKVIVHPSVAEMSLSKETSMLNPLLFTAFPAHRAEFCEDDQPDETRYRLDKIVLYTKWDRAPAPALSARFLRVASSVKSTGGKKLGIMELAYAQKMLGFIQKEEGFLEAENFLRERVKIENEKGVFTTTIGDKKAPLDGAKVVAWFNAYALGGVATSEATR